MSEFGNATWKNFISQALGNTIYIKALFIVLMVLSSCVFVEDIIGPFNKLILVYGFSIIVYDLIIHRNIVRNRYWGFLFAVCFFIGLSIVINFDKGLVPNTKTFAYAVLELFVIAMVPQNKTKSEVYSEFKTLLRVVVIVLSIIAVLSFITYILQIQILYDLEKYIFIGVSPDVRLFGVTQNPNTLGVQMVILILSSITLFLFSTSKKKWWLSIVMVLAAVCLMLSGSRAAQVAFVATIFFFIFFYILYKTKKQICISTVLKTVLMTIVFSVAACGCGLVLQYVVGYLPPLTSQLAEVAGISDIEIEKTDQEVDENNEQSEKKEPTLGRVETNRHHTEVTKTGSSRLDLWEAALKIFKHHPLFGVGFEAMEEYGTKYTGAEIVGLQAGSVHNMYLQILASSGIFAFLSFIIMIAFFVLSGLKKLVCLVRNKSNDTVFFLCLFSCIGMILIRGCFELQILYVHNVVSAMFAIYLGYFQYLLQRPDDDVNDIELLGE